MFLRYPARAAFALWLPIFFTGCAGSTATNAPPREAQANFEQAVALLQLQSHNPDSAIRANCLEAVQVYHNPRVTTMLEQGLHDPDAIVRFAAAMSAGRQKSVDLLPALHDLFESETDDSVRVAIVFAQRRMGNTTNMNLLAQTLRSKDPTVRANTALVLGFLGDPSAIVLLYTAKSDNDSRVRLQITAALARLGDHDAQAVILALSINSDSDNIYTAIATAADIQHPEANNVLIHGLKLRDEVKDPNADQMLVLNRAALIAARGLGKRGDIQGGKLVVKLSGDPNPSIRALAALALGEMLYPSEEANLVRLMADPDVHVQVAAAAAVLNVQMRANRTAK